MAEIELNNRRIAKLIDELAAKDREIAALNEQILNLCNMLGVNPANFRSQLAAVSPGKMGE